MRRPPVLTWIVFSIAVAVCVVSTAASFKHAPRAAASADATLGSCPAGGTASPSCIPQTAAVTAPGPAARSHAAPVVERVVALASAPPAPALASVATAGMRVAVDPETGQLGVPSPEQMTALSGADDPAISRSAEGLFEVRHPDGSVSINLQGRFQDYAVARVGPNGKLIFSCVEDRSSLIRALKGALPRPAKPEEK